MLRAILKGAGLFAFGRTPGGAHFYRELTRNWMGTQATHVDKLQRVWPGYLDVWTQGCGLRLEGSTVWVHEGGWTPFPLLANYLLTGSGGVVTNSEGRILDKYVSRAVNGALAAHLPAELVPTERTAKVDLLRWSTTAAELIHAIGGREVHADRGAAIPLATASVDLCHSGGVLEHYEPKALKSFLAECLRILKPGGVASHIFDHRDHLFHADASIAFMSHLAWPDWAYRVFQGHRLGHHNRLRPAEVETLFTEAGFERIAVRRMILPGRRYVDDDEALAGQEGIPRVRLARRFRSISDADLRTAAAHYLYRKR